MQVYNMGPGTGKTTTALTVVRDLIDKGMNVVYLSITNSTINDTKERFLNTNPDLSQETIEKQLMISTMHSYIIKLLRENLTDIVDKIIPSDKKVYKFKLLPISSFIRQSTEDLAKLKVYINDHIKLVDTDGTTQRVLTLPLDYAIHLYYIYKIAPSKNDFIIIDEAQDFEQDEVKILADSFGDNAVLFQDINQTIFQFRWNDTNIIPIKSTNEGATYTSYRNPKDTCILLNNILKLKHTLVGSDYTALTYTESSRVNVESSIDFIPISTHLNTRNRQTSNYTTQLDLISNMARLPSNKSMTILTLSNIKAVIYTKHIESILGNNILATKYVSLSYHPLYKTIKYLIRAKDISMQTRNNNANAIYDILNNALYKIGYGGSVNNRLDKNIDRVFEPNYIPKVHTLTGLRNSLSYLDKVNERNPLTFGNGYYTSKSESRAIGSIMSILASKGMQGANSGIRLDVANPTTNHKVLTVHAAKGLESDIVLVDFSGFTKITSSMEIVQLLNIMFVAMSRHKDKCYVFLPSNRIDKFGCSSQEMDQLLYNALSIREDENSNSIAYNSSIDAIFKLIPFCATDKQFKNKVMKVINYINSGVKSHQNTF